MIQIVNRQLGFRESWKVRDSSYPVLDHSGAMMLERAQREVRVIRQAH